MASKAISEFLTMPEPLQLLLLTTVQQGGIALEVPDTEIEGIVADYWSGRKGFGSGVNCIFPYRMTGASENLYIIHKDVCLYLNLLFTGKNLDYLYTYRIAGVDGEFSQEMKEEIRGAVILEETTVELSGVLKCEAFSKAFRGYDELTPISGVEVNSQNPLEGSAVFHISKRTYDRVVREQEETVKEKEYLGRRKRSSTPATI